MRYKSYRYRNMVKIVWHITMLVVTYSNPSQLNGKGQAKMTVCFKDWSSMGKGVKDSERQTWHQSFANHRKEHEVGIRNEIVRGKRDWKIPVIVLCWMFTEFNLSKVSWMQQEKRKQWTSNWSNIKVNFKFKFYV